MGRALQRGLAMLDARIDARPCQNQRLGAESEILGAGHHQGSHSIVAQGVHIGAESDQGLHPFQPAAARAVGQQGVANPAISNRAKPDVGIGPADQRLGELFNILPPASLHGLGPQAFSLGIGGFHWIGHALSYQTQDTAAQSTELHADLFNKLESAMKQVDYSG